MTTVDVKALTTKKLISIYDSANAGSETRKEAIRALGRVGGHEAAMKLISIYDGASAGSETRKLTIGALGEVSRA